MINLCTVLALQTKKESMGSDNSNLGNMPSEFLRWQFFKWHFHRHYRLYDIEISRFALCCKTR